MKPSEILREATKLDWTQWAMARDLHGHVAHIDSGNLFCAVGRLKRCQRDNGLIAIDTPSIQRERTNTEKCAEFLKRVIGFEVCWFETLSVALSYWNDTSGRTREEVDAAFLKAAELAESEGQ